MVPGGPLGGGFVLDGFPRTLHQARELDRVIAGFPLHLVIDLDVPREIVFDRIAGRRVCENCQRVYHVNLPPDPRLGVRHVRRAGPPARRRHRRGGRAPPRAVRARDRPDRRVLPAAGPPDDGRRCGRGRRGVRAARQGLPRAVLVAGPSDGPAQDRYSDRADAARRSRRGRDARGVHARRCRARRPPISTARARRAGSP